MYNWQHMTCSEGSHSIHTSESDQVIYVYIQRHRRRIDSYHGYRSDIIGSERELSQCVVAGRIIDTTVGVKVAPPC